jgi:hypothetical protein
MSWILVAFEGVVILGLLAVCATLKNELDSAKESQPIRDAKGRFTKKNK